MKKKYITPRVKVVAVRTMNVLCISGDAVEVNNEEVDEKATKEKFGENFFNGAW